jgi:hypothetical protein
VSLFFLFVQFEFTHAVGPHAGRYLVEPTFIGEHSGDPASLEPRVDARNQRLAGVGHGVGASDVLVVGIVGAPAGERRRPRRARPAERETSPATVPLSVVTFVRGTSPFDAERAAASRLEETRFSEAEQLRWVRHGLTVLNLAIRGYRTGAPDPYALEVTRRDARRIRIGYGTTEDVQNGGWQAAFELPPAPQSRSKRIERLRPYEAVAAVLSGKSEVLEAEDLLSRALIDLDQQRSRAAAFGAAAALRLLASEFGSRPGAQRCDLASLASATERAEQLASEAAAEPLDTGRVSELESVIEAAADVLDSWRYQRLE